MLDLNARIKALPNICGIQFAFEGNPVPATIEGYQPFYNAIPGDANFQQAYFGHGTVSFGEESDDSAPGISYKQKLSIRFRTSDGYRPERLAKLHRVRYIKVQLSNYKDIIMGRNDFDQNARPRIRIQTDEKIGQADFETVSIFPSGYTPNPQAAGLPVFLPIDLIGME